MKRKRIALVMALTGLICISGITAINAQTQGKSESTIELSYIKSADMTKTAVAIVKVRNDSRFVPAKNTQVNFYVIHDKEQKLLNSAITNNKGKAVIVLPDDLQLNDDLSFTIIAKVENNSLYEDAQDQIHFKNANLSLRLNPHDTNRLVTARVMETGKDGKEIPVKGTEVKFYVQRMFGIMPEGEDNAVSTDEKGEAIISYPNSIPGDTAGAITVIARIENNEQFGNVESKAATSWGTVLVPENLSYPRALWEPNAPLPLIIIILTTFGGVWCAYFFIFFRLIKIKIEKN